MIDREELLGVAHILRLRAQANDPLDATELHQLVAMLQNIAAGRGALESANPIHLVAIREEQP